MSPSEPIDLLAVRSLLDDLLQRLPSAEASLPRTAAADGVSRALAHVYGALAARTDLDRFRDETRAALGDAQRALATIEPHGSTSPSAAQLVTLMTQAVQAISEVRYRPLPDAISLPRAGESKPWLRASVGEPTLLDFTRPLIAPTVPLAAAEPEDPLSVPEIDLSEDAPSEPIPELEEALAKAKLGAPEPDDEEEADEPDAEPTSASELALVSESEPEPDEDDAPEEPALALAEPPPEPRPPAGDEALEGHYFGESVPASEILAQQARVCLEEMGNLGLMRRPEPDQGWLGRAEAERRLLARVDAIAACGAGVFSRLVRSLDDRPIPDPELTWALLFFFGSLAGDDAHDQMLRIARLAPLDSGPDMVEAVADALALVPQPAVASDLRPWLSDPSPERRMVALAALARRGALETPQVLPLAAEPDPRVAEAAAAALASSKGPIDARVLGSLLRHAEEEVVAAAIESAVIRRLDVGVATARALVVEGRADFAAAAEVLGVTGDPQAFEPLLKAAEAGSATACTGLGWLGSLAAVDFLAGQLEGPNKFVALAALQRLTAASLTAEDPAPEYDEDELPFRPAEPSVPEPDELLADPAAWRTWWSQHGQRAKPDARQRFGGLWSVWSSLVELEAPFSVRRDRRLAHLELCACFPIGAPLDQEAFVARQKVQLAAWRPLLEQAGRRGAGSWTKSRTGLR